MIISSKDKQHTRELKSKIKKCNYLDAVIYSYSFMVKKTLGKRGKLVETIQIITAIETCMMLKNIFNSTNHYTFIKMKSLS